jgi:signal recognition particle subunit SRP54
MFDSLSEKLNGVFKTLRGHGKLTEKNIQDALKDVRMSLLEADVNFRVVKDFIKRVKDRALGEEVMKSLTPGQQFVKIVNQELTETMGGSSVELNLATKPPVSIMLVGLQGSGKTTSSGKLALMLKNKGKKPYLVPADIYRPAAIEQLTKLAARIDVPVFPTKLEQDPVEISRKAMANAELNGWDVVIIDTAGRLHVDKEMMQEVKRIKDVVDPSEILFVADAMTGQDAVNAAKEFNDLLDVTGVVLTKMDGDARGGAALSIRSVTGKPLKLVGVGEKLEELEVFHPDRIAGRILDMGDVLTLIEKAEAAYDEDEAAKLEKKLRKAQFTLEDFRDQLQQFRKMGSLESVMSMMPGMGKMKGLKDMDVDETQLTRIEAIINSMTPSERKDHQTINGSRRQRIAKGSGTKVQDVNALLKQYAQVKKMITKMAKAQGAPGKGKKKKRGKGMGDFFPF